MVGTIDTSDGKHTVFSFVADDEIYFGLHGAVFSFLPAAGMDLTDLALQYSGAAWIGARDPVDLAMCMPSHSDVPSLRERHARGYLASTWRRLSHAVGRCLATGVLS